MSGIVGVLKLPSDRSRGLRNGILREPSLAVEIPLVLQMGGSNWGRYIEHPLLNAQVGSGIGCVPVDASAEAVEGIHRDAAIGVLDPDTVAHFVVAVLRRRVTGRRGGLHLEQLSKGAVPVVGTLALGIQYGDAIPRDVVLRAKFERELRNIVSGGIDAIEGDAPSGLDVGGGEGSESLDILRH